MNMSPEEMLQDLINLRKTFEGDVSAWQDLGIAITMYCSGTANLDVSFTKTNEIQVEVSRTEPEKGTKAGALLWSGLTIGILETLHFFSY